MSFEIYKQKIVSQSFTILRGLVFLLSRFWTVEYSSGHVWMGYLVAQKSRCDRKAGPNIL